MHRLCFGLLGLAVFLTSSPSVADVLNGGSAELFLRCSELHRRSDALQATLKDLEVRAGPAMARARELRSEVKRHEAEARRLEKIANIMRNSNDVQRKYRRAVRRYKEAFGRYKRYRRGIDKTASVFDSRSREFQSVSGRARSECDGNWKISILDRFCDAGEPRHKSFCSGFGRYRQARKSLENGGATGATSTKRRQKAGAGSGSKLRAPLTDCDRLATHEDDPGRVAAGVEFKNIRGREAVRSCKAAVATYPDEGRFHAYLSRAYDKVGDNDQSMYHARRSADLGYPFGFHYVSLHYVHGMGVKKDSKKEFQWSQAAAEQGLPVGMHNTGVAYREGTGTPKNLRKAAEWLEKAIKAGFEKSHWQLGLVYEEGIGGKPRLDRAARHHRLAVRAGVKEAGKALARVRAKLSANQ